MYNTIEFNLTVLQLLGDLYAEYAARLAYLTSDSAPQPDPAEVEWLRAEMERIGKEFASLRDKTAAQVQVLAVTD